MDTINNDTDTDSRRQACSHTDLSGKNIRHYLLKPPCGTVDHPRADKPTKLDTFQRLYAKLLREGNSIIRNWKTILQWQRFMLLRTLDLDKLIRTIMILCSQTEKKALCFGCIGSNRN